MERTNMTPTDKWKRKVLEFCDANNTTIASICHKIGYGNSKHMKEHFYKDLHYLAPKTKAKINKLIKNGL